MRLPIILINFKAYESSVGSNALELARICSKVAIENDTSIGVCVQAPDICGVSSIGIPVFAQHIDPCDFGSHTGSIMAESVRQNGATGTLINHSEKPMELDEIEKAIIRAKKAGLISVVCASTSDLAAQIARFAPDAIAIEPPELIGGDISVTTADPAIVSDSVSKVNQIAKIPVLCGAGVKDRTDVKKAIELGAQGVLVASGITNVSDPYSSLKDMIDGLK